MAKPKLRKHKKRKTFKILFSLMILLLLCTCLGIGLKRQDWIYLLKQNLAARFTPSFTLDTADVETTVCSLEDLLSKESTTIDQSLLLINNAHPLGGHFQPDIAPYKDTAIQMNVCLHEAYAALSFAVKETYDVPLYVRDAYRTVEEQQKQQEEQGPSLAASVGSSEHQAGLALDVYVPYYAGRAFIKHPAGRFVNDHCEDYGFIIRYPSFGKAYTQISYEPWHLRYVGFPHARIIQDHYLTLEEYMECLEPGTMYQYEQYILLHLPDAETSQDTDIIVPASYKTCTVSPDNQGGYVLTFFINDI